MPQSSAILAIIIVSWNTRALLVECLTSLYATVKTAPLQVWVVDNASTDDSVPYLRAHFPRVFVIENTRNVGFAVANNQALVRCEGAYALLLNSDTHLLPEAIDRLVQLLETQPRAGAAAPMLLNADGSYQAGPNDDLTLLSETLLAFGLARYLREGHYPGYGSDAPQGSYDWIGGTCLLLRRAAWEQVGGLDPSFFMYSEEADWCFRARAAGWSMLYDPAAKIIHLGGGSSQRAAPAMRTQLYRSKMLYFRKHRSHLTTSCLRTILLFTSACKAAGYALLAHLNRAQAATYLERASSFRLVFDEIKSLPAQSWSKILWSSDLGLMQPAPLASILIVNWNACELLRACLASLEGTREPLEIIVVDNNSSDNSTGMLRDSFGNIILIASPTNLGFAAANNLAAEHAHSDYFLLLNPDTTVPSGAIAAMVQFANAHPKIGALGPQLRGPDGSRQRSCWRGYPGLGMALSDALFLWKAPWLPFAHQSDYRVDELLTARPVDHLLGACILIRRRAWEQVGPLDPNYFLFLEETDWCLRARRGGWEIYYLPDVFITHYGQQSMRQAPRRNVPQFYKSYVRFYRAHHAGAGRRELALKSIIALACAVRIGMWELRAHAAHGQARAQANAMVTGYWKTLTELRSF